MNAPRRRSKHRSSFWMQALGLLIAAGMAALYLAAPPLIRQLDSKVYDALLTTRAGGEPSAVPVIVDIDEASLAAYGQWPWPRYLLAELISRLTENGAASIALDIMLAEPDRSSPTHVRGDLLRYFDREITFEGLPAELEDNDALLASVLKETPVILGMFLLFGEPGVDMPTSLPATTGMAEQSPPGALPPGERILRADGAVLPLPEFTAAAPVGSINVSPGEDGVIRALPLLVRLGDKVYPNLSLRALMMGMGSRSMILRSGPDGLESVKVGGLSIPVSPSGFMQVLFRGPRGVYPYYSAKDIMEGNIPAENVRDRIVFVGASAAGLQDIRTTPFDSVYPGVEAHAAMVDSVLSERFMEIPPWTPGAQILMILGMGLLSTLLFGFARPVVAIPCGAVMAGGVVYWSAHLFAGGMYLSPLYILLTVAAEALTLTALRFWQEERQKRMLRHAFSRYVSPEVVSRIADRGGDVFAGEQRELTILFADIRGFTLLSEQLRPEQVVALLNHYFTPMTACIRDNGGTLDKFIGDAIMAFWNAPLDVPDHPNRAVHTALRMQEILKDLNPALKAEYGVHLVIGAGVHTGTAYVGNMGSEELLDYTCIGDNVNLASRLEGLCRKYDAGVLTSAETARRCGPDLFFRSLDVIRVKGKKLPVEIGTVHRAEEAEAMREELFRAEQCMDLYRQGAFSQAGDAFGALRAAFPAREKLYGLYEERCRELAAAPPEVWDGIWTFDSK